MTTHKEIFLKYGIHPPTNFFIPTNESIDSFGKLLQLHVGISERMNNKHVSTFILSSAPNGSLFQIADHEKFIHSFGVDIDLSKTHPELLYKFNFQFCTNQTTTNFRIFSYDFGGTESDKYLSHYFSGYQMQKLFSIDSERKVCESLSHYIENTLNNALENCNIAVFLEEIYKHTIQEQINQ